MDWNDQISIQIEDVDLPSVLVLIETPMGELRLLGNVRFEGPVLMITEAHVGGLTAGALGRRGLNAIGRKLLEYAGVDQVCIQGSTRSTGRRKGKVPKRICFPHRQGHAAAD